MSSGPAGLIEHNTYDHEPDYHDEPDENLSQQDLVAPVYPAVKEKRDNRREQESHQLADQVSAPGFRSPTICEGCTVLVAAISLGDFGGGR